MITKIADGAYFVPSYSEQTITQAYSVETTLQSFGGIAPIKEPTSIEIIQPQPPLPKS